MEIELIGPDGLGRPLYFANVDTPVAVRTLSWPPAHFAVLLVWHADGMSTDVISGVVLELFSRGASYLCAWGRDSERVHDIADEDDAYPSELASPDGAVRMTTSHGDDALEDAVDFFMRDTQPDAFYAPSTNSALVLCIGTPDLAAVTRRALIEARRAGANLDPE